MNTSLGLPPLPAPGAETPALLEIRELSVSLPTPRGVIWPLDDVSLRLRRGETLGLVGESGSGKSMLARAIMGITPDTAELNGAITFDGADLVGDLAAARTIWGRRIAMVFQDSMTSLNPVVRVGRQVGEAARYHLGLSRTHTHERVLELLDLVGIPDPRRRVHQYPHQLSGGMRQRVAIAMALACDPELLIADEATTALDVTVQQQILDLLQEIQRERDMTMIIVSHDLGVVASRTDRIAVMYGGRIAETAPTPTLFAAHRHQYTRALLGSLPAAAQPRHSALRTVPGAAADPVGRPDACRFAPRCPAATDRCRTERPAPAGGDGPEHHFACFAPVKHGPEHDTATHDALPPPANAIVEAGNELSDDALLRVRDLVTSYKVPGGRVHAVSGISFDIHDGETLGMVGESGCGKSSAARTIVGLVRPASGRVVLGGLELTSLSAQQMREQRRRIQIVLQDPLASLNPRRTVRRAVAEGLYLQGLKGPAVDERVDAALRDVGVDPEVHGNKKPHELSGGQAQRVVIARAMVLEPHVLICDEPVSALDVSVRAQVLNLLEKLKAERGLSMLFVSHDLGVVRNISDRIAVMYLGTIVEIADADLLYNAPAHPYSRALIDAVPEPDPGAEQPPSELRGQLPSPMSPPSGCRFRTRCPIAQDVCADVPPPLAEVAPGQHVACHFPLLEGHPVSNPAAAASSAG